MRSCRTAALVAFFMLPTMHGATAQDTAPGLSTILRKNLAPVADAALTVRFPEVIEAQLDNGLTVLVLEDHRTPLVSMVMNIYGSGALYDPPGQEGLARITAGMLREGTGTRTGEQILEELARLGATLESNSAFGSPTSTIRASGLSRNIDEWFPIFSQTLLHPLFPESSLFELRLQGRLGIQRQQASISFLAERRYYRALYGNHPAANRTVNESTLEGIAVDGIAGWHRDRYAPQNSVLAIVGAVEADQIIPWLDQELAEWEASDFVEVLPPAPAPATEVRVHLVHRPGSAQTTLVMGNLSIDRAHPDYVDVRVASNLLGGGPASRLFGALRRDDTDAYAAYSAISALDYAGPWTITSAFRTEATGSVMARIFDELETLWNQPVPESELNAAKRAVVSGYALSLEDPGSLASYALLGRRHGLGDDYWNTYARRVSEVTAEDVTSVLRQHLNPNALQIVVVGDAAQILPVLESYGPVDVFDVDGNLLD